LLKFTGGEIRLSIEKNDDVVSGFLTKRLALRQGFWSGKAALVCEVSGDGPGGNSSVIFTTEYLRQEHKDGEG
jgi:hypothetical protein